MNKDAILATLIGFAIGLTITGIIIVAPTIAKSAPSIPKIQFPSIFKGFTSSKPKETKIIPTQTQQTQNAQKGIIVSSPLQESIQLKNTVTIEGRASSGSTLFVQGELSDDACPIKQNTFACNVTLTEGKNTIVLAVSDTKAIIESQEIILYHTPESL